MLFMLNEIVKLMFIGFEKNPAVFIRGRTILKGTYNSSLISGDALHTCTRSSGKNLLVTSSQLLFVRNLTAIPSLGSVGSFLFFSFLSLKNEQYSRLSFSYYSRFDSKGVHDWGRLFDKMKTNKNISVTHVR